MVMAVRRSGGGDDEVGEKEKRRTASASESWTSDGSGTGGHRARSHRCCRGGESGGKRSSSSPPSADARCVPSRAPSSPVAVVCLLDRWRRMQRLRCRRGGCASSPPRGGCRGRVGCGRCGSHRHCRRGGVDDGCGLRGAGEGWHSPLGCASAVPSMMRGPSQWSRRRVAPRGAEETASPTSGGRTTLGDGWHQGRVSCCTSGQELHEVQKGCSSEEDDDM